MRRSLVVSDGLGIGRCSFALLAGVLTVFFSIAGTLPLRAQEDTESLGELETEETASMRETTYKELAKAQEAAEEENYSEAIRILDKLGKDELNSYESAQTFNLYAYIYFAQDNYPKAINSYERLLQLDDLPEALETGTIYNLGQLYFQTENWRKAIDLLERWLAGDAEPTAQIYEMIAQAHYQLEDYRGAIEPLKTAIELTRKAGRDPNESSYLLLRVLYYELQDYRNVSSVLHELIRRFPRKSYWMQLAGIYGEAGEEGKMLATLELAHIQGYLDTQDQVLTLAGLLLQNNLPYRAGKLLQKGLDDGVIESTGDNWRLLSQAWTLAQEDKLAIPALVRAAELSRTGEADLVLAQTYMNLDRWQDAAESARNAIRKGGLKRNDQAYVILGQALFNLRSYDDARQAFLKAQADSRSRQLAGQWIGYIDREKDRQAQLRDALEN
jgi:tetratricopeptide (TPR) repeat protein